VDLVSAELIGPGDQVIGEAAAEHALAALRRDRLIHSWQSTGSMTTGQRRPTPEVLMYRNDAPPVTITERIAGLIEASGLTAQEFAQRAQLDEARLINALNGLRRFSSLDVALIAEFTETTVDWLITGQHPWGDLRISLCRMPPEA
jgi:hypothetical protein